MLLYQSVCFLLSCRAEVPNNALASVQPFEFVARSQEGGELRLHLLLRPPVRARAQYQ